VLVQKRFAQIIAHDIAGYQSQVERKECSIGVRIGGLSQTMKKWCIPPGARPAFVTVAFESLLFVGEQRLVTDGANALFALSPFEFHEHIVMQEPWKNGLHRQTLCQTQIYVTFMHRLPLKKQILLAEGLR